MTLLPALTATARSAARKRQAHHVLAVRVALVERLQVKAAPAARVQQLATDTGDQIAELAQQLADGDITQDEFVQGVRDVLLAAGATVAELAGLDDESFVADFLDGQSTFLDGFAGDVASGLSAAATAARAAMWGAGLWGLYQSARVSGQPEGTMVTWVLDPASSAHCDSCLEFADGSPYSLDDAPTPGVDTDCLSNCRCTLEFSDGGEA